MSFRRALRGALYISVFAVSVAAGVYASLVVPPLFPEDTSKPVVISFDPGGSLVEFYERYTAHRQEGRSYVIDGYCISACTLVLGLFPYDRVCATAYARLGFHSAAIMTPMGPVASLEGTRLLWHAYPEPVRKLMRSKGWDPMAIDPKTQEPDLQKAIHPELIYVEREELNTLVRPCN